MIGIVLWGWVIPLHAQIRFDENMRDVDVARYTTVEECLAAVSRLKERTTGRFTIRDDTMPPEIIKGRDPWPMPVIEAAQRCSARWTGETASLQNFAMFAELFLVAERDSDVSALLARRITDAVSGGDTLRFPVLDTAIMLYANARPVRIDMIEMIVTGITSFPDSIVRKEAKIGRLWRLRGLAEGIGEETIALRAAQEADAIFTSLTTEERQAEWYTHPMSNIGGLARLNSEFLHFRERLDSLQKSSAAYYSLVQHQHDMIFKGADPWAGQDLLKIGDNSPTVSADLWFPREPALPLPARGKHSLVIPLDACMRAVEIEDVNAGCMRLFTKIQRLHHKFPEVEITLLAYQTGRAILSEPGSIMEEGEDLRRWFLEGLNLPVTIAVEKSAFVRLEEPDGRLVRPSQTLDGMEAWGCSDLNRQLSCSGAFLIDEMGQIVGRFDLARDYDGGSEKRIVSLLRALTQQQTAARAQSGKISNPIRIQRF